MDSVDNPAQEEEFKTVASLCRLTGLSRANPNRTQAVDLFGCRLCCGGGWPQG